MIDDAHAANRRILTAIVVIGLLIDAYVHFHLASAFKQNRTSLLNEPELFRAEATGALIAAAAVLIRPGRLSAALAFLVGAGGVVAVVFYRYVNLGKVGPIPNMYDPYWGPPEKALSAIAEAAAALAALALMAAVRETVSSRGHRGSAG